MPIDATHLKFYRSQTVSDTAANGGRLSTVEIASGVKNNLWPDVPQSERTAGSTKYRKSFLKVAHPDGLALIDTLLFVETPTPGGDRVVIFPATQTDTQNDLTGSERVYGGGWLDANAALGATSISVNVESASDAVFRNGDLIRISDKTTVDDPAGAAEFVRLAPAGAVVWNGNKATLTFASGQSLANAYLAASTRVASVIEAGTLRASADTWGLSSANGSYNGWSGSGNPPSILVVDAIGGIEQTWTVTFTAAGTFTCVGDTLGSVGGGTTSSDFAPNHAAFGRPYFTLPFSGWGGTWGVGDVLSFKTHPAAVAIWQKRIIPPNTGSLSGDRVVIAVSGESE